MAWFGVDARCPHVFFTLYIHIHSFSFPLGLRWAFLYKCKAFIVLWCALTLNDPTAVLLHSTNRLPYFHLWLPFRDEVSNSGREWSCIIPTSVGICFVKFSLCSPQSGEDRSSLYNNSGTKLAKIMCPDWLASWKYVELWFPPYLFCCWIFLAGVLFCLIWVTLLYWDIYIFPF